MRRRVAVVGGAMAAAVVVWGACSKTPAPAPPAGPPPDPSTPAGRIARFECNRCHDAPGKLTPAPREKHCAHCHQAVFAGAFDWQYAPWRVAEWRKHIKHFREVPSLEGLEHRVRRDWLIGFLQAPHDLRPRLGEEMPRLPISEADARLIAAHLLGPDTGTPRVPPVLGDAARGLKIFNRKGCLSCHAFTGASGVEASPLPADLTPKLDGEAMARALKLAPDLRHARQKMRPDQLVSWLADPAALKPGAAMPRVPLTDQERADLAVFLSTTPLAAPSPGTPPALLPPLERPVTHAEVERAVFKRVCWHCHSDPDGNGGDGGPGNTGGLGFSGKGLDFGSRAAIVRRKAYLSAPIDGVPRLVWHLQARHAETAGLPPDPRRRGMPLGLPPLTPEQIQLVRSWVAQGMP